MVIHAVKRADLDMAYVAARREAGLILDQVNFVQSELGNTTFVGEQAEALAEEMNNKMTAFVAATYENVDELMRVIVTNMNVVVRKLGGEGWQPEAVPRGQATRAETLRLSGGQDYEINTADMSGFADKVDQWFEAIAASYNNLRASVSSGNTSWRGPEQQATEQAVTEAVERILGAAGAGDGTGVRGVGSSLSGWIRQQVNLMDGSN